MEAELRRMREALEALTEEVRLLREDLGKRLTFKLGFLRSEVVAAIEEGERLSPQEITDRVNEARSFLRPDAEIITSRTPVLRALGNLMELGIVRREETGRRVTYCLTERFIKEKAEGKNLVEVTKACIEKLQRRVEEREFKIIWLWLYGYLTSGEDQHEAEKLFNASFKSKWKSVMINTGPSPKVCRGEVQALRKAEAALKAEAG